jgi:hypothetical protein
MGYPFDLFFLVYKENPKGARHKFMLTGILGFAISGGIMLKKC